jgi:acylphosphatase
MDALNTWHVDVAGRVQGVNYRAYAVAAARRLGVSGWIRNERDGNVTAVIQHQDPAVLSNLLTVMRDGPPASRVDEVEVSPIDSQETFSGFEIRFANPWRDRSQTTK